MGRLPSTNKKKKKTNVVIKEEKYKFIPSQIGLAAEIPKVLTQLREKAADIKKHLETYMNDDDYDEDSKLLSSVENVIQIVARYHHDTYFMYFDTKLETATPSPSPTPANKKRSHQAQGNKAMPEYQLYLQVESILKTVDGDSNYKLFKLKSIYRSFYKVHSPKGLAFGELMRVSALREDTMKGLREVLCSLKKDDSRV